MDLLIRRNEDTVLMLTLLAKKRHSTISIIMSTSEDTVSVNLGEKNRFNFFLTILNVTQT